MWTVEILDKRVERDMNALNQDLRVSLTRLIDLIERNGLETLEHPHVKHLDGKLWELRFKGKSGIGRALYITAVGKKLVILGVFTKKTQKTPRQEIEQALKRAKEAGYG